MSETVQVEIILYGSFFVYLFPNLEKLGIDLGGLLNLSELQVPRLKKER